MPPKITIIIPVYNAARYIEQCIRSVLNQTMQDVEIIVVNDGSTDDTKIVLDRLAGSDQRLAVFHNSNQGVSAARNFGLQQAKGIYICFCDADDWMEPDMLQELFTAVTANQCDLAICNAYVIREGEPVTVRLQLKDEIIDIASDRAGFLHALMRFKYDNANWNKLFRAAIIRERGIGFEECMCIGEDLLFNLEYMQFAKSAVIVPKPLYNYRILGTSLYSGQSADRLPQFNLLYQRYLLFADQHASTGEADAFKAEMARIAYNQMLAETEQKVKANYGGFIPRWRAYYKELKRFTPAVFYYPPSERIGIQGVKKQLLQRRQFRLFSFFIALNIHFRKSYKFLHRLLK